MFKHEQMLLANMLHKIYIQGDIQEKMNTNMKISSPAKFSVKT